VNSLDPKVRLKRKIQTAALLRVAGRFVAIDRALFPDDAQPSLPVVRNLIMVNGDFRPGAEVM